MFRKISLILALVLVIGALSACAGNGAGTTELTDEKKEEISRAWLLYKEQTLQWNDHNGFRYYGNYDGYDMFYYGGMGQMTVPWEYEIGGQKFSDAHSFQMYAYRNGKFYNVNEMKALYREGKISRKSLAAMAETHREWLLNDEI